MLETNIVVVYNQAPSTNLSDPLRLFRDLSAILNISRPAMIANATRDRSLGRRGKKGRTYFHISHARFEISLSLSLSFPTKSPFFFFFSKNFLSPSFSLKTLFGFVLVSPSLVVSRTRTHAHHRARKKRTERRWTVRAFCLFFFLCASLFVISLSLSLSLSLSRHFFEYLVLFFP